MRCRICDKALSESEVQVSPDKKSYEPCAVCMEIIMDTAYSDGFVREEDITTDLPDDVGSGLVDVLDVETYRTTFDHCDAYVPPRMDDD